VVSICLQNLTGEEDCTTRRRTTLVGDDRFRYRKVFFYCKILYFFIDFLLLFICFVSLSGICSGWVSGEKQKNIRQVVGERKYSR
jgi:hypothetical protein